MKMAKTLFIALAFAVAGFAQEEAPEAASPEASEAASSGAPEAASPEKRLDTASLMKKTYNARGGVNINSGFGFHAGVMVDVPITIVEINDDPYVISIHPGAQFIKKSWKYGYWLYSWRWNAYYIEVPVPLSIKRKVSESVDARLDLGPYIAIGLFGSNNYNDASPFDSEYFSRLDVGLYYGATAELQKKFIFSAHHSVSSDFSTLYLTVGYRL